MTDHDPLADVRPVAAAAWKHSSAELGNALQTAITVADAAIAEATTLGGMISLHEAVSDATTRCRCLGSDDNCSCQGARPGLTKAAQDVLTERARQISAEGWTPERDDVHTLGELGLAAGLYALPYEAQVDGEPLLNQDDDIGLAMTLELACGWKIKPEPDVRRRKVKAAALLLAEIERLDRAEARAKAAEVSRD
ncbi:hypothetical protein EBL87_09140 [Cereibacter sphaeroides]|uniref:hypothetical protein n=1 Tax=Cereibacter sphaeroides TaxID=1063 RepID=UPI000F52EE02|nr:hypothetical protein [Cereibacter sphaeroides]AZB63893.1 hypothetical protein EBL87_09140 [Cereibacter sphaeroides]AZB68185.1 hypothetical protein EBL86_07330 [Cereibacter sphaeroides]